MACYEALRGLQQSEPRNFCLPYSKYARES